MLPALCTTFLHINLNKYLDFVDGTRDVSRVKRLTIMFITIQKIYCVHVTSTTMSLG